VNNYKEALDQLAAALGLGAKEEKKLAVGIAMVRATLAVADELSQVEERLAGVERELSNIHDAINNHLTMRWS
jgi:hypothetical protein